MLSSFCVALLEQQTCGLAGEQCPHSGCDDAKLILLHIKTCPVENCSECPVHYKGCQQSRKLLDHYRKCRDMRARQAGTSSRRAQPHVCLVCSLVARQARNVLDGTKASTTSPLTVAHKAASGSRFSLKQPPTDTSVVVPKLDAGETKKDMPPPPPRAPNGSEPLPIPTTASGSDDDDMNTCVSPPSSYQLKRPGLAALAAAASPSMEQDASKDLSTLGKSLDSSKISFLIDASKSSGTVAAASVPRSMQATRRIRSESVDVASVSRATQQEAAGDMGNDEYDPTLETELTREVDPASVDEPKRANTRRRSASVGAALPSTRTADSPTYLQRNSPCEPIAEETVTTDEPMFLMEEETDV